MTHVRAVVGVGFARSKNPRRMPLACAVLASLLPASAAFAAVLTVGPGGSHATVQSAIDVAVGTPGDDEIRIAAGTYAERLNLFVIADERLDVSGGWNAGFDASSADPSLTVIDAEDAGHALLAEAYDGVIAFRNLTLTRGLANYSGGAGLTARAVGEVSLSDCVVRDSVTRLDNGGAEAGGVSVVAYGDGRASLSRCHIRANRSESAAGFARAGGVTAAAGGTSLVRIESNLITDNVAVGGNGSFGGGLDGIAFQTGALEIVGNLVSANSAGDRSGVNLFFSAPDPGARLLFERNQVVGNVATGAAPTFQMGISGGTNGVLRVADSLVAAGVGAGGLDAWSESGAIVQVVNSTLADNDGLDLRSQGGITIANTLADTTQLFAGLDTLQNNLFGIDPGYVDRAGGDYRLASTSPAIGAGTLAPPGGLGPFDLDGNARVRGIGVDIGAYEADDPRLFVDGFE